MSTAPDRRRRSLRLQGYDYSQAGAYFVTLCTQDRVRLLGDVVDDEMRLNAVGAVIAESWVWLAAQYDYVDLDEWVVMPNHLHGIIVITDTGRGGSRTAPEGHRKPLGRLVGAFKTGSAKRVNLLRGTPGGPLWQRNYYEHIIRDDRSLNRIREYIARNPENWGRDRGNSGA